MNLRCNWTQNELAFYVHQRKKMPNIPTPNWLDFPVSERLKYEKSHSESRKSCKYMLLWLELNLYISALTVTFLSEISLPMCACVSGLLLPLDHFPAVLRTHRTPLPRPRRHRPPEPAWWPEMWCWCSQAFPAGKLPLLLPTPWLLHSVFNTACSASEIQGWALWNSCGAPAASSGWARGAAGLSYCKLRSVQMKISAGLLIT